MNIPAARLASQGISVPRRDTVPALVARLGAVQAQEFAFAKWGIGLRLKGIHDADVEEAFTEGRILRTHVMRPTWHFVAAEDIVWMLELTAPRIHVAMRSYMQHQGLDGALMRRALAILERELEGGKHLTRAELGASLRRKGLEFTGMQLGFVMMLAEIERLICSGPRRGKSFTYASLPERAPAAGRLPVDEALATLAARFFTSHGPATAKDFVWWSGLRTGDARRGIEITGLQSTHHDGLVYWQPKDAAPRRAAAAGVHLLPIYDEYLVAYRDRAAVPHVPAGGRNLPVTFRHALIIDGQVAGTWTVTRTRAGQTVQVTPSRRLTRAERELVVTAAGRYGRFAGAELELVIT